MSKPEDIPQDVWDSASVKALEYVEWLIPAPDDYAGSEHVLTSVIARTILAAKVEERSIFTDAGRDNDALNSAVGVLRTQQAQPHKSTQSILWEAIQDYAERAKVSTAHKNSEVQ